MAKFAMTIEVSAQGSGSLDVQEALTCSPCFPPDADASTPLDLCSVAPGAFMGRIGVRFEELTVLLLPQSRRLR